MPRVPAPRAPRALRDAAVPVACIIVAVGALLAIKEYIYEPYIAPKMEQWAEQFVDHRRAKRESQQGPIHTPSILSQPGPSDQKPHYNSHMGRPAAKHDSLSFRQIPTSTGDKYETKQGHQALISFAVVELLDPDSYNSVSQVSAHPQPEQTITRATPSNHQFPQNISPVSSSLFPLANATDEQRPSPNSPLSDLDGSPGLLANFM